MKTRIQSLYRNRISENMDQMLNQIGQSFKSESETTRMIVVSDSDLTKNLYNPNNQQISPIGYNNWERFVFKGNEQFIINSIEYLLDDFGLLEARGKEVKLRLMNKVKIEEERKFWQFLNIAFPLLLLILGGIVFNYFRRRKFKTNS